MDEFNAFFELLTGTKAPRPYAERKVASCDWEGYYISTADTDDAGFETCIFIGDGSHVVERYNSRDEAAEGHAKWLKYVKANRPSLHALGRLDCSTLGMLLNTLEAVNN